MLTRIRDALVDIVVTSLSTVSRRAVANELIHSIFTVTMNARTRRTLIDIAETTWTIIAAWTFTFESVDHIDTNSTIGAWIRGTLVDVSLTMNSSQAWWTCTCVAVDAIDALSAVATRISLTFVDIVFTVRSGCSWMTLAAITSDEILT